MTFIHVSIDDTKFETGKSNIYLVVSLLCGVLSIKRSVVVDSLLDVSPSGKKMNVSYLKELQNNISFCNRIFLRNISIKVKVQNIPH